MADFPPVIHKLRVFIADIDDTQTFLLELEKFMIAQGVTANGSFLMLEPGIGGPLEITRIINNTPEFKLEDE